MENLGDILKRLGTRSTSEGNGGAAPQEPDDGGEPCPRCRDRGWYTPDVPVGHADFGRIVTCECQKQRLDGERYARLLRYSNLGYLTGFTLESLRPAGPSDDPDSQAQFKVAHHAASEYAADPTGWLILAGPHGSGKTHLAAAIGNECIESGRIVFFVHVPDLLDHLRASFGPASEISYSDLFEQVRNTPLLILDGLGSHSTTPWAEEKLRQIINHRYNAELPTVVTTAAELGDIDPYVLSRLRTPGLSRIIELKSRTPQQRHHLGRIDPTMLQRMTLESFDVRGNDPTAAQRASLEAAHRAAKNFAADPEGWLTLSGETGVGKTHLAIAVAVEHIKKGQPVFFTFVPELLDHLRYAFSPDSPITYDHLFDEVKNAQLLILDDLGREAGSRWAVEKLYQLIVHRHNARLPTVITSILDFTDDLDPITSRVQDPSVGQLVKLDAPDYRNKKRRPQGPRRSSAKGRTVR